MFYEAVKAANQAGKVRIGMPAVGGGDRVTIEAGGLIACKAAFLSKAERHKLAEICKADAIAMKARQSKRENARLLHTGALYHATGKSQQMPDHTDNQLHDICLAYMAEIFGKGMNSQEEIVRAVYKIRGFVDAAQRLQGMSEQSADQMKRTIMSFALLHEERLQPKPSTRGHYLQS
ncbi:hypothetical protein [Pseudomonas putida]|uniref:hypothetical protein n=1 Tax=Pseudomonas putida TaxID=303 RepID=UPI002B244CA3|nr:hypothetical protein [Pseudomonas putida]